MKTATELIEKYNLNDVYFITISGDSYHKTSIKRYSAFGLLKDEMHNCEGIYGMWPTDNVGNYEDVRKKFCDLASEWEDDSFDCEDEHDNQIDSGNGYYIEMQTVADYIKYDLNNDYDMAESLIETLEIK